MPQPSPSEKALKFGRQAVRRSPFTINDLEFSSLPLSLAEERQLADAGAAGDDAMIDALVEALSNILNTRAADDGSVDTAWLMENLTPNDLEGIVDHLRVGQGNADSDGTATSAS